VVLFAPVAKTTAPPPAAQAAKGKSGKDAKVAKKGRAAKAAKAAKAEEDEEEKEKKAPIEKIEELAGKRLGVIGRTKANTALLDSILKQYGIPIDKVTVETIPVDDVTAIKEGKVDAVMAIGPVGSRITADAIVAAMRDKEPPVFLSIGAAEAIAERNPIYEATEIKAGAFGGSPPRPEEALDTVSVNHYIVARKDLSEQTIGDLARLLYSARQAAASEAPGAAKIEAPETGKSSVVTVHPGAAAYIDGTQKNFFERYSDFIYLGILLLSVAGSSLAGLMSFSKAGERAERVSMLERLVALIAEARAAKSCEELDRLNAEADEILKTTLQQAEKDRLDPSALGAFTLALDQARRAISERRGILGPVDERRFDVGPRGRAS
jgi:ABC-type nitrate/sulfonate/bicarbonate transport system substrate-binding protein